MTTAPLPRPLRRFLEQLDGLHSAGVPDLTEVGRILAELAADEEFFDPLIAEIPASSPGGKWLIRPERGPRLVLFHRPEGVMAYTTPITAGLPSLRYAGWRPTSGGMRSAIRTAGPNFAWPTSVPWFPATW